MTPDCSSEILAQLIIAGTAVSLWVGVLVLGWHCRMGALREAARQRSIGVAPCGMYSERRSTTTVANGRLDLPSVSARAIAEAGLRLVASGPQWCAGGAPFSHGPMLCFIRWEQDAAGGVVLVVTVERRDFDAVVIPVFERTYVTEKLEYLASRVHGAILLGLA